MAWFQENWIIAVVGLVVAVALLWWLFGRSKPQKIAPPIAEPAKPAKPLAPVKPEIIAAEPARFKPVEPKPQPAAPAPVAKAPKSPAQPKAVAKPAATKAVPNETAAKPAGKPAKNAAPKPAAKKAAAKPAPAEALAAIPAEPTVPPPPTMKSARAAAGTADNLQLLKGVGPKLAVLLNGLGVTHFHQIADWTAADIARIDQQLGAFQGRITRDNIVDQAGHLARGDKAGFEAKYGALGSEL